MARYTLQSLRQLLSAFTEGSGFDRVARKMSVVSVSEGKCSFELQVDESHVNRAGGLHGGFTATVVDVATTLAIMTTGSGSPGVSTDLNITFVKSFSARFSTRELFFACRFTKAARPGERLLINAHCLKVGKTLGFATADVVNESGTLIAQGRQTKFLSLPKN